MDLAAYHPESPGGNRNQTPRRELSAMLSAAAPCLRPKARFMRLAPHPEGRLHALDRDFSPDLDGKKIQTVHENDPPDATRKMGDLIRTGLTLEPSGRSRLAMVGLNVPARSMGRDHRAPLAPAPRAAWALERPQACAQGPGLDGSSLTYLKIRYSHPALLADSVVFTRESVHYPLMSARIPRAHRAGGISAGGFGASDYYSALYGLPLFGNKGRRNGR